MFVDLQALSKTIQDGKLSAAEAEEELGRIRNNAEKEKIIHAKTLLAGVLRDNM